jgi:hypothetical protein
VSGSLCHGVEAMASEWYVEASAPVGMVGWGGEVRWVVVRLAKRVAGVEWRSVVLAEGMEADERVTLASADGVTITRPDGAITRRDGAITRRDGVTITRPDGTVVATPMRAATPQTNAASTASAASTAPAAAASAAPAAAPTTAPAAAVQSSSSSGGGKVKVTIRRRGQSIK